MALVIEYDPLRNRSMIRGALQTLPIGSSDGAWEDLRGMYPATVTIEDQFVGGLIEIMVSNAPTKPANTAGGVRIGAQITLPGQSVEITSPYRWVKVRTASPIGGASVTPYVYGG